MPSGGLFIGNKVPLRPSHKRRGSGCCADKPTRCLPHDEVCSAIYVESMALRPSPEVALPETLTAGNSSILPLASSTTGRHSGVVSMTVELLYVLTGLNQLTVIAKGAQYAPEVIDKGIVSSEKWSQMWSASELHLYIDVLLTG